MLYWIVRNTKNQTLSGLFVDYEAGKKFIEENIDLNYFYEFDNFFGKHFKNFATSVVKLEKFDDSNFQYSFKSYYFKVKGGKNND